MKKNKVRIVLGMLAIGVGASIAILAQESVRTAQSNQGNQQSRRPIALVGGTLIDGSGGSPVPDSVVLIRGVRIEKVGTTASLQIPPDYEQISTEGMTVLPGLIDLHAHLEYAGSEPGGLAWLPSHAHLIEPVTMPTSARQMLMSGVTTVRDLNGPLEASLAVKKRIANGEIPGATMFVAGNVLNKSAPRDPSAPPRPARPTPPGGVPFVVTVDIASEADARVQTRKLLDAGVDVIKVTGSENMTVEELRAIVTEAHARGKRVTAHAWNNEEIIRNLAAGVDELQHIGVFKADGPQYPDNVVAAIRERLRTGPPLYWCPTAMTDLNAGYVATIPEYLDDPSNFLGLPEDLAAEIRTALADRRSGRAKQPANFGARSFATEAETEAVAMRKVNQLKALGVKDWIFGSNVGVFGNTASQGTWMEATTWVRQMGFDPMAVIKFMTSEGARYLGIERETGTVSEGKYADVIAVHGDPLHTIEALQSVSVVIKHGRRYK